MLKFKPIEQYKPGQVLIPHSIIRKRVKEIAKEISKDYQNKELLIVGVLKGAYRLISDFTNDLHKQGLNNINLSFLTLRSYSDGKISGEVRLSQDIDIHPEGKHVLVVDDILDTGKSLSFITKLIKAKGAKSIKTFALLDKPSRRINNFHADYVGITIPNVWVQGYGMDTDEIGRAEPNVIIGPYRYGTEKRVI
ncbi:MAG TPA: hypoxanthine phosphoribosyltransferase [Patescibacteria group bacterium]|nr:hypoxanthine phosphoribosyltransferase [Patescibacteria group bacterium]